MVKGGGGGSIQIPSTLSMRYASARSILYHSKDSFDNSNALINYKQETFRANYRDKEDPHIVYD